MALERNLSLIKDIEEVTDIDEWEQLLVEFRKKCQVKELDYQYEGGCLYAYRIPIHKVEVVFGNKQTSEDWVLVKVGRTDLGNVADRIVSCAVQYSLHSTVADMDIPGFDPTKTKKVFGTAKTNVKKFSDEQFADASLLKQFEDMGFVIKGDIGHEHSLGKWPLGLGLNVGTARISSANSQWWQPKREELFGDNRLKDAGFARWLLTGKRSNISLGFSEYVVVPKESFETLRRKLLLTTTTQTNATTSENYSLLRQVIRECRKLIPTNRVVSQIRLYSQTDSKPLVFVSPSRHHSPWP